VVEYQRNIYVPPASLLAAVAERVVSTEKPTVRQAVILEQLGITDATPDELWEAIALVPHRCYEHEHGPLLAEIVHRYPQCVDIFEFSFIDGNSVLVSKKGDDEQLTVSLELTPLTEPMVYEAIDAAPLSKLEQEQEDQSPTGKVYDVEKFNPHTEHKVIDDLVYKHDRDRVMKMLEQSGHSKIRQLLSVLHMDPLERGPYEISEIGDYYYLLYKGVEITSLTKRGSTPPDKKPVRVNPNAKSPGEGISACQRRKQKKPLGANVTKKKKWIDRHRSYCSNGCGHCKGM